MPQHDFPPDDSQYEDTAVATVSPAGSGGWHMGLETGWSFYCPADSPVTPTPGMPVRLYGNGIGFPVRGLYLDGRKVFYRTDEEQQAQHAREVRESEQAKRYDFEKNRASQDARYDALPAEFRARLDRFRQGCAAFRWEFESYELFACEQAILIAEALRADGAGEAFYRGAFDMFRGMSFEEQKARVPGLDDGHSGNTFGSACRLAYWFLTRPENVAREHGALTPLVGCEDYGCTHAAS